MATLTVQNSAESGTSLTFASAGGSGDEFANIGTGKTYLLVKNASGGSINVTITAQVTSFSDDQYQSGTKADVVKAVADGAIAILGPFAPAAYNNASGRVEVSYSDNTSVTVAAVKCEHAR